MKIIKKTILSLVFFLSLNNLSVACDLLGINIGGHKSSIENYFGPIEYEESIETEEQLAEKFMIVSTDINSFCPDINLGSSIFKAIIVNDIIAGVSIEVENGTNNEESKKKLLYNYVTAIFGDIENSESPNWTGYKAWSIAGREIIYSKTLYRKKFLTEEVIISNEKYLSYTYDDEENYE